MNSLRFTVGQKYKRRDIYLILGIPEDTKGGNWDTGYNKHNNDWFLFCNIGSPGRTGHDYNNRFIGDDLIWFGKTGSKLEHSSIQSMLHPSGKVFVFYRENDRESFTYAGAGKAKSWESSVPVKIVWEFVEDAESRPEVLPEEVVEPRKYYEGATKQVSVNVYERDSNARRKCIEHFGTQCCICKTDFEKIYGELGKGFIHVHHTKPLAEVGKEYEVDPIVDLRPVCPNCHAMIHKRKPAFSIQEMKDILLKVVTA